MAILYYDFVNNEVPYLNFKVKLTIGIRADSKHVQCVTVIASDGIKRNRHKKGKLINGNVFQTMSV